MDLAHFQQQTALTDQRAGVDRDPLFVSLLGLASEAGTLLTEYKKHLRDGDAHTGFVERIADDLGDILSRSSRPGSGCPWMRSRTATSSRPGNAGCTPHREPPRPWGCSTRTSHPMSSCPAPSRSTSGSSRRSGRLAWRCGDGDGRAASWRLVVGQGVRGHRLSLARRLPSLLRRVSGLVPTFRNLIGRRRVGDPVID